MFESVFQGIFSAAFLASILRVTTPILLPSLGALISDRAGVINIGLEGLMLSSAFTGVVVSAETQDPWLGLVAGVAVAVGLALLLAFFHLNLKADLILSGIALNILGSAGTVAIMFEVTGDRGNTASLASLSVPFVQLPLFIQDIPLIGDFVFRAFGNQSLMTWIAFASVFVVWYMMFRMPFGMHMRAVGENPDAASSVGIQVRRVKYQALLLSGLFAGLGGIHMSMGYLTLFQSNMTNGRGFIALTTPYLGGGHPIGTAVASVGFGFFDAIGIRLGSLAIPSQLPQMIPFVAAVMALVIYSLQAKLTRRVRALQAAQGAGFDVEYWRSIQRLSVLHMLLANLAIIGVIVSVSMFAAPNGFSGADTAYPLGLAIIVVSLILIVISLPFVWDVERIGGKAGQSGAVSTLSLGVYLGLFFVLFFPIGFAIVAGVVAGFIVWLLLGGRRLLRVNQPALAARP